MLEAHNPLYYAFAERESSSWTSILKTETVITKTISYFTGTPFVLQTVITEVETVGKAATLTGAHDEPITHTTPVFTVYPTPGVTLALPAGTYLFYDEIYGGTNRITSVPTHAPDLVTYHVPPVVSAYYPGQIFNEKRVYEPSCVATLESLIVKPTRTEEWNYFYQSVSGVDSITYDATPGALPSKLLKYLNNFSHVRSAVGGSDVFSCTQQTTLPIPGRPTTGETAPPFSTWVSLLPPPAPSPSSQMAVTSHYGLPSTGAVTSTYIRTTYQSTSTHLTVRGCLRCDTPHYTPPVQTRQQDVTGGDKSKPPGQVIHVGDSTLSIYPTKPTGTDKTNDSGQNVIIGTLTLEPGQSSSINNVPVIVPKAGGGSTIIVGTNTYQVLPTSPPTLSVGDATLTANAQGQYIIGSQTLSPGGPAITVNGYTLTLNSDGNRAVVNGVTQRLETSPYTTGAPVLTIGGQSVTATVIDGTTQFIVGPAQTLLPGGALTIAGTTFSMPFDAFGTIVVINGVTSTLGLGVLTAASDLTIAGMTYAATVRDGTTEYVLGPGTTLRPGDVITISGTTYSLDEFNTALVMNGHTSSIPKGPESVSATATTSISPTDFQDAGSSAGTGASTSSKGFAVSITKRGLETYMESLIMGLASWILLCM